MGVLALLLSLFVTLPSTAAQTPAQRSNDITAPATVIDAYSSLSSIFNSQTVVVQYDLTSAGQPVAGAITEVRYGGKSTVVTVNSEGHGTISISDLPVGAAKVIIRYAGDARHAAASTDLTFTVAPRPTKITGLTTSVNSAIAGQSVVVRFVVTSNGKLLADARTAVTYGGKTVWTKTDANGRGAVSISDLPAGHAKILVRYLGDIVNGRAWASTAVTVTGSSSCPAYARACIDLRNSVTWIQEGGAIIYGPVPITSGRPGLRTRPGTFSAYWKHKNHVSSIYGSSMPNSIFFDGGIAFHAGSLSETSHGCIHLSYAASEVYWNKIRTGDKIHVWGTAPY